MALLGTLTIAAGQTNSNSLGFEGNDGYTIHPPATQPETITVQLATKAGVWSDHQSDGLDIEVTAAKALTITKGQGAQIRVQAGVGVAAERIYEVYGSPESRT